MKHAAILVAAGRGRRAGGEAPKQWQRVAGCRVIDHTLAAFCAVEQLHWIVVVVHPEDADRLWSGLPPDLARDPRIAVVSGGATRADSVRSGLQCLVEISGNELHKSNVLIHDAARCCVKTPEILSILDIMAEQGLPAAAPALPVTDALWTGEQGRVTGVHPRAGLYRAQTPQAFAFTDILAAHAAAPADAPDDVAVARAAGLEVAILPGDPENIKVTHAADFARAAKILESRMDIRTGSGFDVHRFGPGDHVMLCGVAVPHERGLQGHSDADVALHAVTDALYGALAEGDIGLHFPPSDPQWKGTESHVFLRHAINLCLEKGFEISNMDITLVCERPRIGPHVPAMRARLAKIAAIDAARVSVKATTSERLGFTGREEGIAAQAVATLVKR